MSEKEYTVVKIPTDLVEEIDKFIGKYGYRTRPEIIKDAIRRLLSDYKRFEALDNEVNP